MYSRVKLPYLTMLDLERAAIRPCVSEVGGIADWVAALPGLYHASNFTP